MLQPVLLAMTLLGAELPVDAPVPSGSIPLEDPGRYRSSHSYEETVEYYERLFRRVPGERWHNIVNLPGIKAKNVESRRSKTNWEYINIYEARGQVGIYIIPRERPPETKKKGKKRKER